MAAAATDKVGWQFIPSLLETQRLKQSLVDPLLLRWLPMGRRSTSRSFGKEIQQR